MSGRLLLYLITEFLQDGRLIRIVGQEFDQYVPLVRDPNVIEYDVIVDDAPSAPSQKELVWNSMIQMLPMLQGINPPPQVMLTLLDYSPLPASLVAKIKTAVQQAAANAPPPPPDPLQLIIAEKQQDIEATKQKQMATLLGRQAEKQQDLQHANAMAEVELRKTIAQENIRLMSKKQDAMIAAGGEVSPLTEGLLAGIKAGAQRFATELTAGQLAQQADVPLGTPTHLGQVPGQPEPPKPGQGSNGAQRR
jgi:non-ribosomal peptide synthetase component F